MIGFRQWVKGLRDLGLGPGCRILAHVGLRQEEQAEMALGALLAVCETLMVPTFTSEPLVVPPFGPPDNAMEYGGQRAGERAGEPYSPSMAPDERMGPLAGLLLRRPGCMRSGHPLLSFAGVGAEEGLAQQSLADPWGPIAWLAEEDGDVLLVDAPASSVVALHYAALRAGRKRLVRWARLPNRIVECPGFPGCAHAFADLWPRLTGVIRRLELGEVALEMIPLRDLLHVAVSWMRQDPQALLCRRSDCAYCRLQRTAGHLA